MIRRNPPTLAARATLAALVPVFALAGGVASAQNAPPRFGCSAPECRQFDFWVGEWNVEDKDGKPAGTNRIERILEGCVLLENWSGARGGAGKSFNLWDASDGKWHQIWVDNQGSRLELSGGMENGRMIMTGTTRDSKGGTVLNRITWTPVDADRVEQFWETSGDGKAWQPAFWGLYRRARGAKP